MTEPLCFILMPFGKKTDPTSLAEIDFDRVWHHGIAPAVRAAGLVPIRADEEHTGGIIHVAMFERLVLCEFAVADLTALTPTSAANVFYELGVRHAARPHTTVTLFARHHPLPFDVSFLRSIPYELGPQNAFGPAEQEALRATLTRRLVELRALSLQQAPVDSPVFQLIQGFPEPNLAHLRTDRFRKRLDYCEHMKGRLAAARRTPSEAAAIASLSAIEQELGQLDGVEIGVVIDLFLSYRAVSAWQEMIALCERLPETVKRLQLVREQLALALNRCAGNQDGPTSEVDRRRALDIITQVEHDFGPNPETLGIKGRIYKDWWQSAHKSGNTPKARGFLHKAIDTYVAGFEADWRDFFPGINALTLLDAEGSPEALAKKQQLLPLVRYAVEQKVRRGQAEYWDHATFLELAAHVRDPAAAEKHLGDALAAAPDRWMKETTARNLDILCQHAAARGEDVAWFRPLIAALCPGVAGA